MQFLYFIPGIHREQLTAQHVIAAGLGDVLRDRLTSADLDGSGRLAIAGVTNGPGGHNGVILQAIVDNVFAPGDEAAAPPLVGYYPNQHTWTPGPLNRTARPPAPAYWIGHDPAHLPAPEDLTRDTSVSGYFQTLGDGREWLCPVIRDYLGKVNLPDVWRLVDGQIVSTVKRDWQWAWDLSGEIWDSHVTRRDPTVETAMLWSCKLLGINYRVGPLEASILGLLGRDEYPGVLRAAIHGPFIEAMKAELKKSESPAETPVNTSPGCEDYSRTTVPAAANCILSPTVSATDPPP